MTERIENACVYVREREVRKRKKIRIGVNFVGKQNVGWKIVSDAQKEKKKNYQVKPIKGYTSYTGRLKLGRIFTIWTH